MADYPVKDGEGNVILAEAVGSGADVPGAVKKEWLALGAGQYGEAIELPNHSDKTVSFDGEFGGATCKLYGSNDDTARSNPAAAAKFLLQDDDKANVQSDGVSSVGFVVKQNPQFIFPYNDGGDGSTAVNIRINANRK